MSFPRWHPVITNQYYLCLSFQMFLVGLTGGIASGKTAVSSMLRELGCPVIDADVVARKGARTSLSVRTAASRTANPDSVEMPAACRPAKQNVHL